MFCNGSDGGYFLYFFLLLVPSSRTSTLSRSGVKTELDETTRSALSPKEVGMLFIYWASKVLSLRDWIWLLFLFLYCISKAVHIFV